MVSGGAINDIADAILVTHSPGVNLFGSTAVVRVNNTGHNETIRFTITSLVTIKVNITLKALAGYTTTVGDQIEAAIIAYLTTLPIGDDVRWSKLLGAALLAGTPEATTFDIDALLMFRDADTPLAADVVLAYNERPRSFTANISITVT